MTRAEAEAGQSKGRAMLGALCERRGIMADELDALDAEIAKVRRDLGVVAFVLARVIVDPVDDSAPPEGAE